jgi:hypothetical protein
VSSRGVAVLTEGRQRYLVIGRVDLVADLLESRQEVGRPPAALVVQRLGLGRKTR